MTTLFDSIQLGDIALAYYETLYATANGKQQAIASMRAAASRKVLNAALCRVLIHADEAGIPRRNLVVDVDAQRLM